LAKLTQNFSIRKAHHTQICLSKKLITKDQLPKKIGLIAGVDVSYVGDKGIGAVAVVDYDSLELLESQVAICQVKLPYIPTLLSFREIPPALAAIKKMKLSPDVFLIDAQGYAHPYRCGFASHLGLILNKPAVGVAKSKLIGKIISKDYKSLLIDKGEVIGEEVTTKLGVKPVYISVGNRVSLETAVEIVKHCSKSRIPEPTRLAHNLASIQRKLVLQEN